MESGWGGLKLGFWMVIVGGVFYVGWWGDKGCEDEGEVGVWWFGGLWWWEVEGSDVLRYYEEFNKVMGLGCEDGIKVDIGFWFFWLWNFERWRGDVEWCVRVFELWKVRFCWVGFIEGFRKILGWRIRMVIVWRSGNDGWGGCGSKIYD